MSKVSGEVNDVTLDNNATVSVDSEDYRFSAESKGGVESDKKGDGIDYAQNKTWKL